MSQQMHTGMHAHKSIPALPINSEFDFITNSQTMIFSGHLMPNGARFDTLAYLSPHGSATTASQPASIAGLATTFSIKNRFIKLDKFGIQCGHNGIQLLQIAVALEHCVCHRIFLIETQELVILLHQH